jgi:hypothetical protein
VVNGGSSVDEDGDGDDDNIAAASMSATCVSKTGFKLLTSSGAAVDTSSYKHQSVSWPRGPV